MSFCLLCVQRLSEGRLDAVFQGEASLTCGVVAQSRLVGRETERRGQIQVTCCGESRKVSLMCL